ncbi:MAG: hypothetical protein HY716_09870 [Planctomycetes bacterium]|nr:hypothetical protein [Planctomycetota bacterium]
MDSSGHNPFERIADFYEAENLWLHVDEAHGAAAVLSSAQRCRLVGIARADSVVIDAHEMLLVSALITLVLFREGRRSYQAFAQEASYLFDAAPPEDQWFNPANRTVECTKSILALKLYVALAIHGRSFFADYIDGMFDLARRFAARLAAASDFELATEPDCNIVCFRYLNEGATGAVLNDLQSYLRRELIRGGRFYITQTTLPSGVFLRVTLINPFTRDAHLVELLDEIRRLAAEMADPAAA